MAEKGPSPRSKFNMPFVERRLDDPTGPDKQFKVDSMQYLLSKGITDENLLAKIMLESGWLNKPSGNFNYFGIKETDKTKGKLVQTTEGLQAYTHKKGKRVRSDAAGIEILRKEIETRGGSIVFENGAIAYDKEGKIKIIDRFKSYNNIEEAFDNFKKVNAKILADPSKIYATDPNYAEKNAQMLKDIRYYLKNYRSSFGIPAEDNINNNFDEANVKDMTSLDYASTGSDDNIKQSITREMILNSSASNEYYGNMFLEKIPGEEDLFNTEIGIGVENKKDGFHVQGQTIFDESGETVKDVDYNLQYKSKKFDINIGKKGDKDRQSIKYEDDGFSAEIRKDDDKTSIGIGYRGKFK
tara:strand:- start:3077 stop:4141 length:1065 start_codon:yes stop_codon:yes gene_type:complete